MQLYLSSRSPWNCTYSTEGGQVLYKVDCPWKLVNRKATISRALPGLNLPTSEHQLWEERHFLETYPGTENNIQDPTSSSSPDSDDLIQEERRSTEYHQEFRELGIQSPPPPHSSELHPANEGTNFVPIADIEFHSIQSTHFRILGEEFNAIEFFKKEGWSWYGRDRVFSIADGKRYKWKMYQDTVKLYSISESSTTNDHDQVIQLVAEFHPKGWGVGFSRNAMPPFLEIQPAGRHIVDLILVTFIYLEKLRSERKNSAKYSNRNILLHTPPVAIV